MSYASEGTGDAYAVGRSIWAGGQLAYIEGRWQDALTSLHRAAEILRVGSKEATLMIDFIGVMRLMTLRWMGDLRKLDQELPPFLKDTVERGRQSSPER